MKKNLYHFMGLTFACLSMLISAQAQPNVTFQLDQVIVQNIQPPWGMAFINSNEILFTEKAGKLREHIISAKQTIDIKGVPSVSTNGQGGMLDVVLHPDFAKNSLVYLSYAVNAVGGQTTAIGRGRLDGDTLRNFTELMRCLPVVNSGAHFGSRIVFDNDNFLYFSMGDRGTQNNAQNLNNHAGKIMRLKDDGTVPADNPFVGQANRRPEIFCYGNRNIQGLDKHPVTGQIYAHEHGPRGGDELNLIKKGANYGWPVITFGINYDGTIVSSDTAREGMEQPITYWVPSIAPCGMTFIKNNQPTNEADIMIGALAGTHITWLKLKDNKVIASSRSLQGYARFRDVRQAPDGALYALTESPNRIIKLKSTGLITSNENHNTENQSLELYPNPGKENFYIKLNNFSSNQLYIRVLDNKGQTMKEYSLSRNKVSTDSFEIEASDLGSGVYFIEIFEENKPKRFAKWVKM
jgi:glucose/arabinose dehydrogenase